MRYLILFVHDIHWLDFKYAELDALLTMHSLNPADVYTITNKNKNDIFLEVELENDDIARSVTSRSICIRAVYELMASSDKLSNVLETVNTNYQTLLRKYIDSQEPWSMIVESMFGILSIAEKNYFRQLLPCLHALGPVNVKQPTFSLTLLLNLSGKPPLENHDAIPAFFGRLVCKEQMRETVSKFDLKKRGYLGPTTLNHSLALLMANLAQARPGDLALDPFVGTASILIALAHFGCRCFGTDIDPRVLRGLMHAGDSATAQDKRSIFENFKNYGLEAPELLRLDNHVSDRHYQVNAGGMFDIIVTDPPYGIRAGARKSGKRGGVSYTVDADSRRDHVPSTQNYPVEEVMLDLLHTAARLLIIGGRLLYLIPTTYDFEVSDLPIHPCLELLQICEQPLSSRHGRRAVLMKKTKAYDSDLEAQYTVYKQQVMSGSDQGFGQLIHKLNRALAANAYYDQEVAIRPSNSCAKRKEALLRKKLHRQSRAASVSAHSDAADSAKEPDDATHETGADHHPELTEAIARVEQPSEPITALDTNSTANPTASVEAAKQSSFDRLNESAPTQVTAVSTPRASDGKAAVLARSSSKGSLNKSEPMDGGWYHNALLTGVGVGFAVMAAYALLSVHFKSRPR